MKRLIFFLLLAGLGFVCIYYSAQMSQFFGRIDFAEKYIGGTRNFYILFGFGLFIIAFMMLFGVEFGADIPTRKING